MNSQPGVNETLALLDTLKSVAGEFAAREEALEKDFRARFATAQRTLANGNEAQAAAAAAAEEEAATALETEKQLLKSRFDQRRARILRAQNSINQQVTTNITRSDAEWRDRTQQGVQAAEIHRNETLANSTANHENFQQNLAGVGDELARLEKAARRAFGG